MGSVIIPSCEILDCEGKVIIVKVPERVITYESDILKETAKSLIRENKAKQVIFIPNYLFISSLDKDKAINMINDYINELNDIKNKIETDSNDISILT